MPYAAQSWGLRGLPSWLHRPLNTRFNIRAFLFNGRAHKRFFRHFPRERPSSNESRIDFQCFLSEWCGDAFARSEFDEMRVRCCCAYLSRAGLLIECLFNPAPQVARRSYGSGANRSIINSCYAVACCLSNRSLCLLIVMFANILIECSATGIHLPCG